MCPCITRPYRVRVIRRFGASTSATVTRRSTVTAFRSPLIFAFIARSAIRFRFCLPCRRHAVVLCARHDTHSPRFISCYPTPTLYLARRWAPHHARRDHPIPDGAAFSSSQTAAAISCIHTAAAPLNIIWTYWRTIRHERKGMRWRKRMRYMKIWVPLR